MRRKRKTVYVVVTPSGRKAIDEEFSTKREALRAIQDTILGAASSRKLRLASIRKYARWRVVKRRK